MPENISQKSIGPETANKISSSIVLKASASGIDDTTPTTAQMACMRRSGLTCSCAFKQNTDSPYGMLQTIPPGGRGEMLIIGQQPYSPMENVNVNSDCCI